MLVDVCISFVRFAFTFGMIQSKKLLQREALCEETNGSVRFTHLRNGVDSRQDLHGFRHKGGEDEAGRVAQLDCGGEEDCLEMLSVTRRSGNAHHLQ